MPLGQDTFDTQSFAKHINLIQNAFGYDSQQKTQCRDFNATLVTTIQELFVAAKDASVSLVINSTSIAQSDDKAHLSISFEDWIWSIPIKVTYLSEEGNSTESPDYSNSKTNEAKP